MIVLIWDELFPDCLFVGIEVFILAKYIYAYPLINTMKVERAMLSCVLVDVCKNKTFCIHACIRCFQ